ncbi:hypothetical protein NUW54_g7300 [Trametes sanguinea]|uniref:Uncharacterized protein n=1 Tax=Trametes sanguinea TaxID=158606 RepID=A0ACC1PNE1_9APHY|nr:hypothetical protein NUW54_g7300 [Trametes sanguinea]
MDPAGCGFLGCGLAELAVSSNAFEAFRLRAQGSNDDNGRPSGEPRTDVRDELEWTSFSAGSGVVPRESESKTSSSSEVSSVDSVAQDGRSTAISATLLWVCDGEGLGA